MSSREVKNYSAFRRIRSFVLCLQESATGSYPDSNEAKTKLRVLYEYKRKYFRLQKFVLSSVINSELQEIVLKL